MRCGDCKHWKPATVYDPHSDGDDNDDVMSGLGWCMRVNGEAICANPSDSRLYLSDAEKMGDRDAAPCDGSGYRAALLTRDRFGCVLFEVAP